MDPSWDGESDERLLAAARSHPAAFGVTRLRVVGTDWPSRVVLTRPFQPWSGPPIRAYVLLVKPPAGEQPGPRTAIRVRAVPADR